MSKNLLKTGFDVDHHKCDRNIPTYYYYHTEKTLTHTHTRC